MNENGTNGNGNANGKVAELEQDICEMFGMELPFDWVSDKCITCLFAQACFDEYQKRTAEANREAAMEA